MRGFGCAGPSMTTLWRSPSGARQSTEPEPLRLVTHEYRSCMMRPRFTLMTRYVHVVSPSSGAVCVMLFALLAAAAHGRRAHEAGPDARDGDVRGRSRLHGRSDRRSRVAAREARDLAGRSPSGSTCRSTSCRRVSRTLGTILRERVVILFDGVPQQSEVDLHPRASFPVKNPVTAGPRRQRWRT